MCELTHWECVHWLRDYVELSWITILIFLYQIWMLWWVFIVISENMYNKFFHRSKFSCGLISLGLCCKLYFWCILVLTKWSKTDNKLALDSIQKKVHKKVQERYSIRKKRKNTNLQILKILEKQELLRPIIYT